MRPSSFYPLTALSFHAAGGESGYPGPTGNRKLRIAFLVPEDRQTGTYFRYHNLAVALRQLGHEIIIYSQSSANRIRSSRELRDGIPYVLSATAPGNRWMLPPTNPATFARRLLTRVTDADIYHLFQPFPSAAIPWMWLKRNRPGLFVYDWDDYWINDEFGLKNPKGPRARWVAFWIRWLENTLPAASHLTTTVSHSLADLAMKREAPRCSVIYNGVWPQGQGNKFSARATLNLDQDAFYAGLMGWSGEIEWCLESIRRWAEEFPKLRLAITGRDPGTLLHSYQDISSRVDYLGALPPEKFTHFNAALDLGLVPMRDSDFNLYRLPYKLTDHLAGGIPVLCSRIGETARLADELEGVIACAPNLDAWLDAFRQTVARLSSEPQNPALPTQAFLKRFSWLKIGRQMGDIYSSALATYLPPHNSLRANRNV